MHLDCARAERDWIEGGIAEGIDRPRRALVSYREPAVIHGRRGHKGAGIQERASQAGCVLLQRRAGGGAVLAGPWLLGLHLLLPPSHALSQASHVAAFVWLGSRMRDALVGLGVPCTMSGPAQMADHNASARQASLEWVCFAGLSHGELLDVHGRKLLGLAQGRGRWGSLLSTGLLLAQTPWEMLETIHLGRPRTSSAMHLLASAGLATLAPSLSPQSLHAGLLNVLPSSLESELQACSA